jgi:uncharacterized RDD family membrane protein YckC
VTRAGTPTADRHTRTAERTPAVLGMISVVSVDDVPATGVVLRRYAQYALDFLMLMTVVSILLVGGLFLSLEALMAGWPRPVLYVPVGVALAIGFGCALLNEVWLPHKRGGATVAMRWLGLRIVRVDGGSPRLRDYLVRWLLNCVDGQLFGLLGAVIIAVTPRHQRLGDIVARTLVVRVRGRVPFPTPRSRPRCGSWRRA